MAIAHAFFTRSRRAVARRAVNALWITLGDAGKGYPETVEDLVPATYASYARIFHPVRLAGLGDMRWAQLARLNGREPRRGMQLPDILELGVPSSGRPKLIGDCSSQLPRLEWHELGPILRFHTTGDFFTVGIWEGQGQLPNPRPPQGRLILPNRQYYLVEIPFDDWHGTPTVPHYGANLVWPADRSWFMNSDIDSSSTYVGGSKALVADILSSAEVESEEAYLDDRVHLS